MARKVTPAVCRYVKEMLNSKTVEEIAVDIESSVSTVRAIVSGKFTVKGYRDYLKERNDKYKMKKMAAEKAEDGAGDGFVGSLFGIHLAPGTDEDPISRYLPSDAEVTEQRLDDLEEDMVALDDEIAYARGDARTAQRIAENGLDFAVKVERKLDKAIQVIDHNAEMNNKNILTVKALEIAFNDNVDKANDHLAGSRVTFWLSLTGIALALVAIIGVYRG